jgi:hypothetical protein
MGTSNFARHVFETALSKYEAYGKRLRGPSSHRHSHTTLRIHQHRNRRFVHFTLMNPRGLGSGEGCGDTVVIFLERADNTTLDVAADILGLPAASLPRNTRSDMSLPIRWRPPAAQRRRLRRGVRSQARRHLPLPPRGER